MDFISFMIGALLACAILLYGRYKRTLKLSSLVRAPLCGESHNDPIYYIPQDMRTITHISPRDLDIELFNSLFGDIVYNKFGKLEHKWFVSSYESIYIRDIIEYRHFSGHVVIDHKMDEADRTCAFVSFVRDFVNKLNSVQSFDNKSLALSVMFCTDNKYKRIYQWVINDL